MQSSAGVGGCDLNRGGGAGGGLTRFCSAPASWLEALLDDEDDPLKPSQTHGGLTQLLTAGTTTSNHNPTSTDTTSSPNSDSTRSRLSSSYSIPSADPGILDLSGGIHHSNNMDFHRQDRSPADGYFSGLGIPMSYDYLGSSTIWEPDSKFIAHLKVQRQSGAQVHAGATGMLGLEMQKLFDDSVPCRVRAKRGCATHPRSIAERVRRTRISDRIRKLQELVPNIDKQTHTADMLEEVVQYVKGLQKEIEELSEHQKNCRCITKN